MLPSFDKPYQAADEDVASSYWVWLDIDPLNGANHTECLKALTRAKLPDPTITMFSGRGIWAFWQLDRPISGEECREINRWLVNRAKKGAPKSVDIDTCVSPAHLARLCGTTNNKTGLLADVNLYREGLRYPPSEFGRIESTKKTEAGGIEIQHVDADLSKLPEHLATLANEVWDADNWPSRSHQQNYFVCEALRHCVSDDLVYACITDRDLEISKHVLYTDKGCKKPRHNAASYAKQQIRSGKMQLAAEEAGITPFTEKHFAFDFIENHPDIRYCAQMGCWLYWDGQVWQKDETFRVVDEISYTCDKFARLRQNLKLGSNRTVSAVTQLVMKDQRIAVRADDLDADDTVLNTPAGIVDLTSGDVLPHSRDALCTKITSVGPEGGEPGEFNKTLDFIAGGDLDFREYLLRIMGYALTGSTAEQKLFMAHGTGNNCKSVLFELQRRIMNDYARVTDPQTLTTTTNHPAELADLRGARLVLASETERGTYWAESRIKRLTGGDEIPARFMRQDWFTFTPHFTLVVVGNHRPLLRTVDKSITRRLRLLPFNNTLPDAEVNQNYLDQKLMPEAGRVLRVLIEAAVRWFKEGMETPALVEANTAEFLESQDTFSEWLADRCVLDAGLTEKYSSLSASYVDWCRENNVRAVNAGTFREELDRRGLRRDVGGKGVKLRTGVALTDFERERLKGQEAVKKAQREIGLDALVEKRRQLEAEIDSMREQLGLPDDIPF